MSELVKAGQANPPSVIADMAQRFGMDKAAFQSTLMKTIMPSNVNVTNEQVAAFLLVAKQYELNPFTKEIFAFPNKGGIQPVVSVDGWAKLINDHPSFNGMDFRDTLDDKGQLVSITCKMHRKDRDYPVEVTEYLAECKRPTEPWTKWPARMLRHKAMIQAARYAFGFSGIVDPDEADRIKEANQIPAEQLIADERKQRHDEAAEQYEETINAIKDAIEKEDWYSMTELWATIPSAAQTDLWLAPTKGGIFSTFERECIKTRKTADNTPLPPKPEVSKTPDTPLFPLEDKQ